jgi:hypothetical protein
MAQQLGTVTDETADTDTLQSRLQKELANNDGLVMMPPLITAWTCV